MEKVGQRNAFALMLSFYFLQTKDSPVVGGVFTIHSDSLPNGRSFNATDGNQRDVKTNYGLRASRFRKISNTTAAIAHEPMSPAMDGPSNRFGLPVVKNT